MAQRRYYKETRFEHFRTFCTVARLGSFAAAGTELELSRTTVWQQIDALQRDLAAKLFWRNGRRAELTDDGRRLLELVQPSVAAVDSVKPVFRARQAEQGGVLRLASVERTELYRKIIPFRTRFPKVHVTLVERRSVDVAHLVENGRCDLGLALSGLEMPRSPAIHYEPVGRRDFVLITPANHPLSRKRRLKLADLVAHPLITFAADNPLRRHVEQVFTRGGLLPSLQVAVESDGSETIEQCVALGIGIGLVLLPPRPGRSPLHYRSVAEPFGSLPLCLLWRKGAHLLPHVEAFVEMARKSGLR